MSSGIGAKSAESVYYRTDRSVGFNARVEPFWGAFRQLSARMGFFEKWRERRRLRSLAETVDARLRSTGASPDGWADRAGNCVCNLRVARMGLVAEFKRFVRNCVDGDPGAKWPHLTALRDGSCMVIPPEFSTPVEAAAGRRKSDIVNVVSLPRVRDALSEVNELLRIEETFPLRKMVEFLDATESDISNFESKFGSEDGFWAKFTYVLLRKLVSVASEHRLPVILA